MKLQKYISNIFYLAAIFFSILLIIQVYLDPSISHILFIFSLIFGALIIEYTSCKILSTRRSLLGAYITGVIGALILFRSFGDTTFISHICVVIIAIFGKNLLQRYSMHYFNPIVLGGVLVMIGSSLGIIDFPLFGWQGASSTMGGIDVILYLNLVFGLWLVYKTKKIFFTLSFFTFFGSLYLLQEGIGQEQLSFIFLNGTLYFFLFLMLLEPKTSRIPSGNQITFGMISALLLLYFLSSSNSAPYILSIFGANMYLFLLSFIRKNEIPISSTAVRYLCVPCGYIYDEVEGDPDSGIAAGTKFEDIPDDWRCPICGATKSDFIPISLEEAKKYETGKVISHNYINENKNVLELKVEFYTPKDVIPGQYVSFIFSDHDGEFRRNFSIAHQDGNILTFLIRIEEHGRVGRILPDIQIGDELKIGGVYGSFVLQNQSAKKVFIATGTGLAPIWNMMLHNTGGDTTLIFGGKDKKDIFYTDRYSDIPNLYGIVCLSRTEKLPDNTQSTHYISSRINIKSLIDSEKLKNLTPETEFYICGNPKVVESVVRDLGDLGFQKIFTEKFS